MDELAARLNARSTVQPSASSFSSQAPFHPSTSSALTVNGEIVVDTPDIDVELYEISRKTMTALIDYQLLLAGSVN